MEAVKVTLLWHYSTMKIGKKKQIRTCREKNSKTNNKATKKSVNVKIKPSILILIIIRLLITERIIMGTREVVIEILMIIGIIMT